MAEQMYELKVTATAEVRDADGHLVSSEPVETTTTITAAQAAQIKGDTSWQSE